MFSKTKLIASAALQIAFVASLLCPGVQAQILQLIPNCGRAGITNVCATGSGWAEPNPVCRYTFAFDGATVAPDQPDGLFGPPRTSFIVPAGASKGMHDVRVQLRLNFPDKLLQERTEKFEVVEVGGGGGQLTHNVLPPAAGSGEAIEITFKPPPGCESSCKKITFIQTVQRFADGTITKASDWPLMPDAAKRDALETIPGRRRVDMSPNLTMPYYSQDNTNNLPTAGSNAGFGQIGSSGGMPNDATLYDRPNTPSASFPAGVSQSVVKFEAAPFCAEGDDAGKFLGNVMTWEHHQTKGSPGTIENVSVSTGDPSAEFNEALNKWVSAKTFPLPTPKPNPCN